jgi:hypothetical protein
MRGANAAFPLLPLFFPESSCETKKRAAEKWRASLSLQSRE